MDDKSLKPQQLAMNLSSVDANQIEGALFASVSKQDYHVLICVLANVKFDHHSLTNPYSVTTLVNSFLCNVHVFSPFKMLQVLSCLLKTLQLFHL